MQTVTSLTDIYRPIQEDMDAVRASVADLWAEALRLVHGEALPQPRVGGKMLRPALCLLSAGAIGAEETASFVPLAVAMELLHLAALAHDDVIDGADRRHGMQSLNARWDNHTAVLGGDYLVARAITIMGTYNSCSVITNAINSVREMAEGELTNFGLGPDHYSLESCVSLARQKTASLFAVTCGTPGCLVEGEPRADLHAYGLAFGIAFQLVDDLLDLSQDPETLGKPAFGDVIEGKKTLPLLYLREGLDTKDVARLDSMKGKNLSEDDKHWIAAAIESTGARDKTATLAREYCEDARNALAGLRPSVYRDAMMGLTEFVVVRGA